MTEEIQPVDETLEETPPNLGEEEPSVFASEFGLEIDTDTDELGRDEYDRFLEESDPYPVFDEETDEYEDIENIESGEGPERFEEGSLSDYAIQSVGGLLDVAYNVGELVYDIVDSTGAVDAVEDKVQNMSALPDIGVVQFNIKGFEHYDPKKPFIHVLSDEEFDKLYSEGKANYVPRVAKSDDMGANFARDLTRVVAGLIPAARILKWGKAGLTATGLVAAKSQKGKLRRAAEYVGDVTSVGAVGSLFAFKPYEPRLANSMTEFVDNTPVEFTQPFFEWMEADDSNSKAKERAMIMLESVIADMTVLSGFSVFAKVLKRERNLLKAEKAGASPEQLEKINQAEIKSITSQEIDDVVYPPSMTPSKQKAKEVLTTLQKSTKNPEKLVKVGEGETKNSRIFLEANTLSEEGLESTIKNIASAIVKGDDVALHTLGRDPLINTRVIDDKNVENFINALSNELDREVRALGSIPKNVKSGKEARVGQAGIRTQEEVKEEGIAFANFLRESTQVKLVEGISEGFDMSTSKLFSMMSRDIKTVRQMDARMAGYNLVLNDMTNQFMTKLNTLNLEDGIIQMRLTKDLDVLNKLWNGFSEIPRGMARSLSSRRIILPNEYLDKAGKMIPDRSLSEAQVFQRNKFLTKTLTNKGYGAKFWKHLRDSGSLGSDTISRSRALRKAATGTKKGLKAYNEIYRGLLLWNLRSMTTNLLGNIFETAVVPTSRIIGSMATLNYQGVKEQVGFITSMFLSLKKATGAGFDSLIHERNLLDPLRTKAETPTGDAYRGFYSQMEKVADAGYWHPLNYIPLIVNTATSAARGSLRILGSQDEFFKTLNYNAKALSKVSGAIPDGLTRSQRKDFISKNLAKFYDEAGEATDRELLEYSRRVTFQESLDGVLMNQFHNMISNSLILSHVFPFFRTPVNLISRWIQRTPILNFFSRRTKDMLRSGDQQQVAEVIGNTVLGIGLYGSALSNAMSGTVTGAGPIDPEKNQLWKAAGFKPFSFCFKGPSGKPICVKYDRLEPLMMPQIFVSTLHENLYRFREDPESLQDAVGVFVGTTMKTLTDRTWLRGIKTVMDSIDKATLNPDQGNALYHLAAGQAANYIPTIVNQVYRITNDSADAFRQANLWLEKIMKKLPPTEGYNAVKHNWLTGKPSLVPSGHNFGLDTYDEVPNKYMRELMRFGKVMRPPSKSMLGIDLTGKQYARLNELNGTAEIGGLTLMESIEQLMDSPEYDFDENRVYHPDFSSPQEDAVSSLISDFRETAKFALLDEDENLYQQWLDAVRVKSEISMGIEQ